MSNVYFGDRKHVAIIGPAKVGKSEVIRYLESQLGFVHISTVTERVYRATLRYRTRRRILEAQIDSAIERGDQAAINYWYEIEAEYFNIFRGEV